ncbi:CGL20 [Auxenochlorella protothecoides x Auxenochlorella symbiontica]|uniref:Uncharacterized protein n=1 Tax=Auxenochlorella protothecoides TaxID=3075 RepID=A0A1D1ZVK3_AUXPR
MQSTMSVCMQHSIPFRQCETHAFTSMHPQRARLRTSTAAVARRVSRCTPAGLIVKATYPEPETEKERSPIDFPQEWLTPQPSRRPDIFPEFEKLDTPLPKPLPGDPELPDEEEEEEKKKNPKKDPDEEDPEKEKPEPSQPDE